MTVGFPHPPGEGGPGSFQRGLEKELIYEGFTITYPSYTAMPDIVLVVGGTSKIWWLLYCKLKKVPIVYRLDGLSWLHKKKGTIQRSFLKWFKFELQNNLSKIIHAYVADYIVYQSIFVQQWWDKKGWRKKKEYSIIYNGVDIDDFSLSKKRVKNIKLSVVEGVIDYTPYAVELIEYLAARFNLYKFEVAGMFKRPSNIWNNYSNVVYLGKLDRQNLPAVYQNSIYLSLDINAACPNTVIEAMACGAPVVGYDTGALKELVRDESGIVVNYGQSQWNIGTPNFVEIGNAIEQLLSDYEFYSSNARNTVVRYYTIKSMTRQYITVINDNLER